MSYDLQIWSINRCINSRLIASNKEWSIRGDSAVFSKRSWQIVVGRSDSVLPEDIPDEIVSVLPGIKFLTNINLEPISAPASAISLMRKVTRNLAKDCNGVIFDPQEDSIDIPRGVKRFLPKKIQKERFSVLELSWWFKNNSFIQKNGLKKLVRFFERYLPEALPRRYGLYEPPQYLLEEKGTSHFIEFLQKNKHETIVCYTTKPVIVLGFSIPEKWGYIDWGNKNRFRSNYFSIEFDAKVLDHVGWNRQIMYVWKKLSHIIQPFYGDVRILKNAIRSKSTYGTDEKTEDHPIAVWWWTGIPQKLGQAVVLGDPYIQYWPKFKERAVEENNLFFISTNQWKDLKDVTEIVDDVPKEIAQKPTPKKRKSEVGGITTDRCKELPENLPF